MLPSNISTNLVEGRLLDEGGLFPVGKVVESNLRESPKDRVIDSDFDIAGKGGGWGIDRARASDLKCNVFLRQFSLGFLCIHGERDDGSRMGGVKTHGIKV